MISDQELFLKCDLKWRYYKKCLYNYSKLKVLFNKGNYKVNRLMTDWDNRYATSKAGKELM